MSIELIAELATSHGGDVDLACDMVQAAADAGAHTVKIQSYTLAKLNPADPQAEWLTRAYLDEAAHERVARACQQYKVGFLSTPFDIDALYMLRRYEVSRLKIASSEAGHTWWRSKEVRSSPNTWLVSWPWGKREQQQGWWEAIDAHLTAIPLYPTPLECLAGVTLLDGYSDHAVGTAACTHMLSRGAKIIEAHFCLPGRSRQMPWDKTPEQFREIRDWADTVETMTTGVSTQFRDRWSA